MRIPFLDWLRIFAFTSVLVGHKFMPALETFINAPGIHATPKMLISGIMQFFHGGAAGVIVFMMVSGYIITHVLTQESTIEFLIKRIFRIYPLYITAVILQNIFLSQDPNFQINWEQLLPQLLLIGDFFDAPYTLMGVEWTLRVEVMFYLFMAIVKMCEPTFAGKKRFVIMLFMLMTSIPFLPPFPRPGHTLATDYFWLYGSFLFIGVFFYLFELRKINKPIFSAFISLVFYVYYQGIMTYAPWWGNGHYALLAFILFFLAWYYREHFKSGKIVMIFSNLTYSIYLFHNWLFDEFLKIYASKMVALILLFSFCYLCHIYIEKKGIILGKKTLKAWKENSIRQKLHESQGIA